MVDGKKTGVVSLWTNKSGRRKSSRAIVYLAGQSANDGERDHD